MQSQEQPWAFDEFFLEKVEKMDFNTKRKIKIESRAFQRDAIRANLAFNSQDLNLSEKVYPTAPNGRKASTDKQAAQVR